MQNFLLLSLVLTTSLLFTACETTQPENTHMMEDGSTMMNDDTSMMGQSAEIETMKTWLK